jgi:hypothetical protein
MARVGTGGVAHSDIGYSRGNRFLIGLIGLGQRFSRLVIDDKDVRVRMRWGIHAPIPPVRIQRVGTTVQPFFAWGAHGWRGRWLVNGSSEGIVALENDPPARTWAIGSAPPPGRLHQSCRFRPIHHGAGGTDYGRW